LDQEEAKRKKQGAAGLYIDIEKFDTARYYPTVVYLESGTLYLQGCHLFIEYFLSIGE